MEMLVITVIALVAFAAVLIPLFRRGARPDEREFDMGEPRAAPDDFVDPVIAPVASGPVTPATDVTDHADAPLGDTDDIEREVLRYRAAVRAGTVCRKCGQANPADSAFCFECGAALPRADAKEFE